MPGTIEMNPLYEYKERYALTDRQMAQRVGVTRVTMSRHIHGASGIKDYNIKKYAEIFDIDPYALFCIGPISKIRKDETGNRYGRLTVIEYIGLTPESSGSIVWLCRCDCGELTTVKSAHLRSGQTRSCGCLQIESRRKAGGRNKLEPGEASLNALFYSYQKSARGRSYEWHLTKDQFRELTKQSCNYCGIKPSNEYWGHPSCNGPHVCNGIDRVDNSRGYVLGNVVPCCSICNNAKGTMTQREFYDWIKRAYYHVKG